MKLTHLSTLAAAVAATLTFSANTLAEHHSEGGIKQTHVGIFGGIYNPDSDRPDDMSYLNDGTLVGAELGFRFTSHWGARIEAMRTFADTRNGTPDVDGFNIGLDAMYYLDEYNSYVFFGGRQLDDDFDDELAVAVGIGTQWGGASAFRLITEAGYYVGVGDKNYNDLVVKLGVSYHFGDNILGTSGAKSTMKDMDGDGVMDGVDQCPNTPMGASVNNMGCELDSDNDGVVNSKDSCPSSRAGAVVDASGCERQDDDGDGVLNAVDNCPNTAQGVSVDSRGCAMLKDLTIKLRALFDNDSSNVNNPNSPDFIGFATFLKANPEAIAIIEGHTSIVGDADYNMTLSEQRAAAVKAVLVDVHGADANQIETVGFGETRPLIQGNTLDAHAQNRRVMATVTAKVTQ